MRLRNNKNVIMRGKEGAPKPEKTIDIFRKFYYLLLFAFIGYLIYYFIFTKFIVRGMGYVEFDVVSIYSPVTGKVIDLNITKKVNKNQFLCNIQERIKNNIPAPTPQKIVINDKITAQELKLIDLKAKYKMLQEQKKLLEKKLKKLTQYQILELYNYNEKSQIDNVKNQLEKIKLQMNMIKVEIKTYKNIPKPKVIIKPAPKIPLYSYINHPIYSPASGIMVKNVELNNTVVKIQDVLFKIQTNKNLKIVAYFSQKNIAFLKKNDEVKLYLPDGKLEKGIVTQIAVNNFNMQAESSQKLKVIIIPKNKNIKFWDKYRFLNIKIRKYKWQ